MSGLGIGALVLAAGASRRMGRPKALVRWRGASFAEHVLTLARAVDCAPIVLVSGAARLDEAPDCTLCHNPDWEQGQLSSLQRGLRALDGAMPSLAGILVLTVDRPAMRPETVQALVEAWRREPTGLWQPRHQGRSGHPMLYPADLVAPLLALDASDPEASPRDLVRSAALAPRRRFLDVDDPGVTQNVDTPADLAALDA